MGFRLFAAVGVCLAAGCSAASAPLEAYGKLPAIEQAVVSPSGAFVAYVVTDGENRTIAILPSGGAELIYAVRAGAAKLQDMTWAGDEHVIVTTSTTKQPSALDVTGPRVEHSLAFDLDLSKRRLQPLLEKIVGADEAMNTVYGLPAVRTVKGIPTVFIKGEHFLGNTGQLGLISIPTSTDKAKLVDPGFPDTRDWLIGPDGAPLAQVVYGDRGGVWTLKLKTKSGWRSAQTVPAPVDTPSLMGLTSDGKAILIGIEDEKLGFGWRELSLNGGAWGDLREVTVGEAPIFDRSTDRLIGSFVLAGDAPEYRFEDPHDAAVWQAVTRAYPGDLVTLVSWSKDREKILVRVDSPELGPAYALVDMTTHHADWLGAEYTALAAEHISPVKPVRYKAADGLEITGYLTLPRGRNPHDLPLIVLAHGGPEDRDTPGFDYWVQALASRGYAVLQANFRGSSGFGRDFVEAGYGEWGRKMQTDLSDGVRYLVREGIADPKRVCIVGASYGGYAALAGATIDHNVYRCAVSYGGVADLSSLVTDFRSKSGLDAQRYWFRFIGATDPHDPVMRRYSPLARAAEADIPILLIHGKDDTVVPISQSQRMADALKRAGKPVEFKVLEGEDHWLSRGDTRLAMLEATVDFLERNNPPK